jgi:protein phosphatase 1 regulatory subunit 16A
MQAGADTFKESREGLTPLHLAAANGNVRVVEILIKAKAHLNPVDHQRFTPLHFACQYGHVDVVKLLLKSGANPHIININGHKPYDIAADDKVFELFKNIAIPQSKMHEDINSTIPHQR